MEMDGIPLPPELQKLADHETCCKYCGVSYLVYNEFRKLSEERDKLARELKVNQDELERLKKRVESVDATISTAEEGKRLAESRFEAVTAELDEIRRLHSNTLRETNAKGNAQITTLSQQLDEIQSRFYALRSGLQPGFTDRLTVLQETIAYLKRTLSAVRRDWIENKLPSIVTFVQQIHRQHDELIVNERASAAKRLTECKWKLDDEKAAAIKIESELSDVKSRLNAIITEYDDYKTSAEVRIKEGDESQSRLRGEIVEFGLQIRHLEVDLSEMATEREKSRISLAKTESRVHSQQQELAEANSTLEGVRDDLATFKATAKTCERQVADLRQAVTSAEKQARDWKGVSEKQAIQIRELEDSRESEMLSLTDKVAFLEREVETQQQALRAETQRWKALESSHRSQLSDVQENFGGRIADATRDRDEKVRQLTSQLQDAHEDHRNEVSRLEAQLSSLKLAQEGDSTAASKKLRNLQSEFAGKLELSEKQVAKFQDEVKLLTQKLASRPKHDLSDRVSQLEAAIVTKEHEIEALQITVQSECEERQELSGVIARLKSQLASQGQDEQPEPVRVPEREVNRRGRGTGRGRVGFSGSRRGYRS